MSDSDASRPDAGISEKDIDIDWTKEPATERERNIRAVILRKETTDSPYFARLKLGALFSESATTGTRMQDAASDFRAAYDTVTAVIDDRVAQQKKQRIKDAIREVDGYGDLA